MPLALGRNARSFFATVYSSSFSGVARIDARTSAVTEIKPFFDPANEQAVGAFDGRWLVWNEYHGFWNDNDFKTWAWDSRTGRLTRIGTAAQSPGGGFWESPWGGPDVLHGVATWAQGIGSDQLKAVHVYDLRSGSDMVVRRGHTQESFLLDGRLVAWPESPSRGATTRMYVASSTTGERVEAPPALGRLRGVSGLRTDRRRIAYPSAPYKALWWSPSLRSVPQEILAARGLDHIDDSVEVAGRWIGFGIYPGVFLADTKARRYLALSRHGGSTLVDATTLLVAYGAAKKALHPHLRIAVVPLRDLPPIPACS